MTRVLVTGCRRWYCYGEATDILRRVLARHGPDVVVIHGVAPGVDSAFVVACNALRVRMEAHPADWGHLGNAAGPIRNQEMVDSGADFCIAMHRDLAQSKGTRDCVLRCLKAGIPVWHISAEDAEPVRITEVPG